ncbi:uncharacterized protein [Ptychodera flava]|uniref:uncharacterized protein n=1 Tax=Ptychodera flava TaxID=63121 RepID=UPI00396A6291
MARCLLFLSILGLALLPLLLPSHCQAYPLDIAKFLQRHRKSLHRLAQIRRRSSWDDSGFGGFGDFADQPFQDPVQHHTDHGGFGGFADTGFGAFEDTPGFGDFVEYTDLDTSHKSPAWDDGDPFAGTGDDGFGHFLDLPPKSNQWSETKHKEAHHGSRSHHDRQGGFVNKGFNDAVDGKSKAESGGAEWAKFKTAYRGVVSKLMEEKCERAHVSCFHDSDCYACGPLYSCMSATCKVVSTSGHADFVNDHEDKDWFDDGYFLDEPFDFGELSKKSRPTSGV